MSTGLDFYYVCTTFPIKNAIRRMNWNYFAFETNDFHMDCLCRFERCAKVNVRWFDGVTWKPFSLREWQRRSPLPPVQQRASPAKRINRFEWSEVRLSFSPSAESQSIRRRGRWRQHKWLRTLDGWHMSQLQNAVRQGTETEVGGHLWTWALLLMHVQKRGMPHMLSHRYVRHS